jgi:hypothetical protein
LPSNIDQATSTVRRRTMRYVPATSTRHLIWKIRTLALIIGLVLAFGYMPVFARGGGHSGGHGRHSGGHPAHHGGHVGGNRGEISRGIIGGSARGHFMNQNPCIPTDKTLPDCPRLGEKQWQMIPTDKAANRFESRFE